MSYRPDIPQAVFLGPAAPPAPRRRGVVPAVAGVCLLVGVLAGSAVANTARPAPTTVTTPPVTTIRAPVACVNAIAGLAKVSLRQFRIIDLYRDALHNAHVASWARADAMYQHMTDGTVGVKHAADVCVKATKGASG